MKNRLPSWFKQEIPGRKTAELSDMLSEAGVHTVCRQAKCPNIGFCFENKELTFMILGSACTRSCAFCNVAKATTAGLGVDEEEPLRISRLVEKLELDYVVITSVNRDDLIDAGAGMFAETIRSIRSLKRGIKIEVLIPDFQGNILSLKRVVDSEPDLIAHNLETVPRLYKDLRPQADYRLSLTILKKIKELNSSVFTKSSLMLGFGETQDEVIEAMRDLRDAGCDCLTLGQYLAPSEKHYPVKEFIAIEQFQKYKTVGDGLGFKSVSSGPKVRSSFRAQEAYDGLLCA